MSDTPLMKQYRHIKSDYPDVVLFFRLGDFYEMFFEDAIEVSSLLNLTLTHRVDAPMCGIPFHAAKSYIKRLLDFGKKIAICEQIDLPGKTKELVKREVVRIITPATVVDEDFLGGSEANYILCVYKNSCSWCDISTGEFRLKNIDKNLRIHSLSSLIAQISPREILVCDDEYFSDDEFKKSVDCVGAMITKLPDWQFNQNTGFNLLCKTANVPSLKAFGIEKTDQIVCSAGALLKYALDTSKSSLKQFTDYVVENDTEYVQIDEFSRKNLEIFSDSKSSKSDISLFSVINRCKTHGGTRLLKFWLAFPLKSVEQIKFRQDNVKYFYNNSEELKRVRKLISSSMDLNRISTRIILKRAVPHDLTALKQSVFTFVEIISEQTEYYYTLFKEDLKDSYLIENVVQLAKEIESAINPDFLGQFVPGNVIKNGYDKELDEKRNIQQNRNELLNRYLENEKINSGITILKLGYNKIIGYYLEVPKGQLSHVPSYFLRKQTLVNGERFTTEELKKFENEILLFQAEATEREELLFQELVKKANSVVNVLQAIGSFMNEIDVYQALAVLALDSSYSCPLITTHNTLKIVSGRHPVVEHVLGQGKFVPNNYDSTVNFSLITGPNMAGKSTYLRQNALIILLAHIGSFVPAKEAEIGVVDHIYCRVGASDNLSKGESTFLVEMQETAYILRTCTKQSFVIVDEIGRGTSTQDGMSIAWAVMKELIEKGCKTLFATHFHELTMIDTRDIRLLTLAVKENGKDIVFLRKIIEGTANSSYGIFVAHMAGIPSSVIKNATSFQKKHFAEYNTINNTGQNLFSVQYDDFQDSTNPLCEDSLISQVIKKIRDCNPLSMTPLEALEFVTEMKNKLS